MEHAIIRARNLIVSRLAAAVAVPIALSDQQDPEAEPPYGYYSFITPYAPTGEMGNHTRLVVVDPQTQARYIQDIRAEYPEMVLSFTFCSKTHEVDGVEVEGETEAMQLATAGEGWLQHAGAAELSLEGLVVLRVDNLSSRSGIVADEYVRRWGFDAAVRYKAQTIRNDGIIDKIYLKPKLKEE